MGPLPNSCSAPDLGLPPVSIGWTEPVKPSKPVQGRHPGDPPIKPAKALPKASAGIKGRTAAGSPYSPKHSPRLGRSQTETNLHNSRDPNVRSDGHAGKVMVTAKGISRVKGMNSSGRTSPKGSRPSLPVSKPQKAFSYYGHSLTARDSPRQQRSPRNSGSTGSPMMSARLAAYEEYLSDLYTTTYSKSFGDANASLSPRSREPSRDTAKRHGDSMQVRGHSRPQPKYYFQTVEDVKGYGTVSKEQATGLSMANVGIATGWVTGSLGDNRVLVVSPRRRELELRARNVTHPNIDRVKGFARTRNGGYWNDRAHANFSGKSVTRPLTSPRCEDLPKDANPALPGPGFGRTKYGGFYPARGYEQYLD